MKLLLKAMSIACLLVLLNTSSNLHQVNANPPQEIVDDEKGYLLLCVGPGGWSWKKKFQTYAMASFESMTCIMQGGRPSIWEIK